MKLVLALVILLAGIAGGAGLGVFLKPVHTQGDADEAGAAGAEPEGRGTHPATAGEPTQTDSPEQAAAYDPDNPPDYVKFSRPIVVPVLAGGETKALMLFEIALDVEPGNSEAVYGLEPRLRDAFLRNLLEMSYTGAFMGTFTDDRVLGELRVKLLRSARRYLGEIAREVLILDIVRQEYQK